MAEFHFFDPFLEDLARRRLDETRFGVYLTGTEPSRTLTSRGELPEIAIRNGYPGPMYLEHGIIRENNNVKVTSESVQFTAAGPVAFRAPVLFADEETLVGWWADEPIALANGETFILEFEGLLGISITGDNES